MNWKVLIRWVPIALGVVLIAAGAFLISPLFGALIALVGLAPLGLILVARISRGGTDGDESPREELRDAWDFRSREIAWMWGRLVFGIYLIAIVTLIDGFGAPTVLFSVGLALFALQELVIEPRMLARVGKERGLSPNEVGADQATLRLAVARQLEPWSAGRRIATLIGVIALATAMALTVYSLSVDRDVPDLTGLQPSGAAQELDDHDLEIEVVGTGALVCSQDPEPGTAEANKGDTVTVALCSP